MDKFFEVNNLCYSYLKKPLCLKDVCFSAENNEKVLILGIKDSGKTTLLKNLSGFDDKYFGSIRLNGKEMKYIPDAEKNVSLIFDYPTLIDGSIDKNLDFLFHTLKIGVPSTNEKLELLKKFNLNYNLKTNVKKLTKFEQFELCFLRVFVKNPRMIFIDDILKNGFSATELLQLKEIFNVIFDGKTVFLCSDEKMYIANHDFFKQFSAAKILYLNLAKIYEFKTIDEFLDSSVDLDAVLFNENLCQVEGYCVRQDDDYFLSVEEKYLVKIDKKFNKNFEKLKLADGENEDVVLVFEKSQKIEFDKNNDFNLLLRKGMVKIFSKLDRSRII